MSFKNLDVEFLKYEILKYVSMLQLTYKHIPIEMKLKVLTHVMYFITFNLFYLRSKGNIYVNLVLC